MAGIDHTVADQSIIYVIDRCPYIGSIVVGRILIEFLCHDNIVREDTCDLLLQNMIGNFLKIFVNGQVDVVAGYRFYPGVLIDLQNFSQVVDCHLLLPIFSLKGGFHILLDSRFTDHCIRGVIRVVFFQLLQLLR